MLEGRCWKSDAGGAMLEGCACSSGIRATMASVRRRIRAHPSANNDVLLCSPFVGVVPVAAVGFGGHILLSSLVLSRRSPAQRMRQAGAQQKTSWDKKTTRGWGTLAGGTLAHST